MLTAVLLSGGGGWHECSAARWCLCLGCLQEEAGEGNAAEVTGGAGAA